MIVHNVVQGSAEWMALRIGKPTASGFHRIYQPHRKKPSLQRDLYLHELVHEFAQGRRDEPFENHWTRRGRELEAEARFGYSMQTGSAVQKVGFVTRDDGLVGCSPDGLVGDDVALEIKCKSPQIHTTLLSGKDPGHIAQCQGVLYVTERSAIHLYCYSDIETPVLKVIERDDAWIDAFVPVLTEFLDELQAMKDEVARAHAV